MKASVAGLLCALFLLGIPTLSSAMPMLWVYSGVCKSGACSIVPAINGTLASDPTSFKPRDQLNEHVLFGDLIGYHFSVGPYEFSGSRGLGEYFLDVSGHIVGGTMVFGNILALEFLSVGNASWHIQDDQCKFLLFCTAVTASGTGGYTSSTVVIEPAVLTLMGFGLLGLGLITRGRRRNR